MGPPEDEVHVWVVRVPSAEPPQDALLPDERRRAASFHRGGDRRRFVAARDALRRILAAYIGTAPQDVAFSTRCARCGDATHGKPALAAPAETRLHFSASHSGDVALVAVAQGVEVGVDVEAVRADFDHREIASRFFAPHEGEGLDAGAFYALWTRKEALLKLAGLGLAGELHADAPPGAWARALDVGEGYAAAVAVDGPERRVVVRPWP